MIKLLRRFMLLYGLVVALSLGACGGGVSSAGSAALDGAADASAVAALSDKAAEPAEASDIVDGLMLTRLDVALAADATVGQVNSALQRVGARITAMRSRHPTITVAVPRQTDAAALTSLAALLQTEPGIRLVMRPRAAQPAVAPPAPANSEANFGYLQQAHFPAAWNARRAAPGLCIDRVTVIVADFFHRPADVLYTQFATQLPRATEAGTGSVPSSDTTGYHGYDVAALLAAGLDNVPPTGAHPFSDCLDVRLLQLQGLTSNDIALSIDAAVAATSGKVVVNTSFGFADRCGLPDSGDACTPANLRAPTALERAAWAAGQRALIARVADRLLVTSAAGNEAGTPAALLYPGMGQAAANSMMNIATATDSAMSFAADPALWRPAVACTASPCLPDLTATPAEMVRLGQRLADLGLTGATPPTNVLIVGSIDGSFVTSTFSDSGAHVFAVGEKLPTLLGQPAKGTSMAAPQVGGLAAYLWLLSPELRARPVADTIAAIRASTDADALIDAHAAALSLDETVPMTAASARVRRAILDVDGDGDFDLDDLRAFHDAYVDPATGQPRNPAQRDHSRFDLNGDGFTGGATHTAKLDLDPDGSVRFGQRQLDSVTYTLGGRTFTQRESVVSDVQALCFYAASPLYSGSAAGRDALLRTLCGLGVAVTVQPLTATISPGASLQFIATVSNSASTAVTWSASGGFISPAGLFVAPSTAGRIQVRATSVADPSAFGDAEVVVAGTTAGTAFASGRDAFVDVEVVATVDSGGNPPNADQKRSTPRSTSLQDSTNFDVELEALREDLPERARAVARATERSSLILGSNNLLTGFDGSFSLKVSAEATQRDDLTDPVASARAGFGTTLGFRVREAPLAYTLTIAVAPGTGSMQCTLQGGTNVITIVSSGSGFLPTGEWLLSCAGGMFVIALAGDSLVGVEVSGSVSLRLGP